MINYEEVLLSLVKPIVDDGDAVSVSQMESINEDEILLYIYAKSNDIARLIGRHGNMASAIRSTMQIASREENKRITVKFEAI